MPTHLKTPSPSPTGSGNASGPNVPQIVADVIHAIRRQGDAAVRTYSEKFDSWSPAQFRLSQPQLDEIIATVPKQTLEDIKTVQQNVRHFAEAQRKSLQDFEVETQPGVILGQKNNPIERVGW